MAHKPSDEDVIAGMMAVIGSTTYVEAAGIVAAEGRSISEKTLREWTKNTRVAQYEKLREEWAPKIEARLANNLLDNAQLAAETERMAIEQARSELESGRAKEPAKMARDLSQVKAQAIDKRLALQGRPTQITERRDVNEITRALIAMRVARIAAPMERPADTTGALLALPGVQPGEFQPAITSGGES